MIPIEGRRRLDVRAEQVVWHLVSAGVLGLLVILLLFSIALLDGGATPGAADEPPPRVARPLEERAPAPPEIETSMQSPPSRGGGRGPAAIADDRHARGVR